VDVATNKGVSSSFSFQELLNSLLGSKGVNSSNTSNLSVGTGVKKDDAFEKYLNEQKSKISSGMKKSDPRKIEKLKAELEAIANKNYGSKEEVPSAKIKELEAFNTGTKEPEIADDKTFSKFKPDYTRLTDSAGNIIPGNQLPEGWSRGMGKQVPVTYYNDETGQVFMANSGSYKPPEGSGWYASSSGPKKNPPPNPNPPNKAPQPVLINDKSPFNASMGETPQPVTPEDKDIVEKVEEQKKFDDLLEKYKGEVVEKDDQFEQYLNEQKSKSKDKKTGKPEKGKGPKQNIMDVIRSEKYKAEKKGSKFKAVIEEDGSVINAYDLPKDDPYSAYYEESTKQEPAQAPSMSEASPGAFGELLNKAIVEAAKKKNKKEGGKGLGIVGPIDESGAVPNVAGKITL
jgi:hypothetical protein